MATYNLRRFSQPDELKAIKQKHLILLLVPYKDFFFKRGITLPFPENMDDVDYEKLVGVFMTPDFDTPKGLVDALYFIDEMATQEGMDILLEEAENSDIHLESNPDPTPADIAIQIWLQDKDILERKHAEQFLTRPRSFEYFQTDISSLLKLKNLNENTIKKLETSLDNWFEKKKRGRNSRVFFYPKEGAIWFLVRHGDTCKREGSIEGGKSSSVFYRPEKHDVLVYEPSIGEIRINARSKGEKELYRKNFGLYLFGHDDFFPDTGKYTLEPLKTDGIKSLVCIDVEGMEWVKLKEVCYFWGGSQREIEIRKADDIFAALEERGRSIPDKSHIFKATFQVKFTDSKTPRTVNIRPSNIAQYTRDGDSAVIEYWLTKRGFIITEKEVENEESAAAVGMS